MNRDELLQQAKHSILDFVNYEYGCSIEYKDFEIEFPDITKMGLAYTTTEDDEHEIQFELNLKDYIYTTYFDGIPIKVENLLENQDEVSALKQIIFDFKYGEFTDFVSLDDDDICEKTGLIMDDDGNFYDPKDTNVIIEN